MGHQENKSVFGGSLATYDFRQFSFLTSAFLQTNKRDFFSFFVSDDKNKKNRKKEEVVHEDHFECYSTAKSKDCRIGCSFPFRGDLSLFRPEKHFLFFSPSM